jgi:hypothetical protein
VSLIAAVPSEVGSDLRWVKGYSSLPALPPPLTPALLVWSGFSFRGE